MTQTEKKKNKLNCEFRKQNPVGDSVYFLSILTPERRGGGGEGSGKGGRYAFVLMYVPVYHQLPFFIIFFFLFLRRGWGWGSEEPLSLKILCLVFLSVAMVTASGYLEMDSRGLL